VKFEPAPVTRSEKTVSTLNAFDAAWIALARVSADQLDGACSDPDESRYTRGVLIARHLAVLDRLIARPDTDSADDLESLFAGVRDTPPA